MLTTDLSVDNFFSIVHILSAEYHLITSFSIHFFPWIGHTKSWKHKHDLIWGLEQKKSSVSQIWLLQFLNSFFPISLFRLVVVRLFTCLMFSLLGLLVLMKDYKTFLRVVIYWRYLYEKPVGRDKLATAATFLAHGRRGRMLSATADQPKFECHSVQILNSDASQCSKVKTQPAESWSFHVTFNCFDRYFMTADKPAMPCTISITSDLWTCLILRCVCCFCCCLFIACLKWK